MTVQLASPLLEVKESTQRVLEIARYTCELRCKNIYPIRDKVYFNFTVN